jgi:endonuclease/exonuclease/phosphatase family metal-dependent hydrolase
MGGVAKGDNGIGNFKPQKPLAWLKLEKHFSNFQFFSIFGKLIHIFETMNYRNMLAIQKLETLVINTDLAQVDPPFAGQIKILTSNMFFLPQPFAENHKKRIKLLVEIIKKERPDLVALQEVWTNYWVLEIIKLLPEYNASFSFNPLFNRSGLLTLSKWKINKSIFFQYPMWLDFRFEELLAGKGFLETEIQINNTKVGFINTHLYSAHAEMSIKPNYDQLPTLTKYLKTKKTPLIVSGDLNLEPAYVYKVMGQDFIHGKNMKPTAGNRLHRKLDYILLRQNSAKTSFVSEKRVLTPRLSDHVPVVAKIKLIPSTPEP